MRGRRSEWARSEWTRSRDARAQADARRWAALRRRPHRLHLPGRHARDEAARLSGRAHQPPAAGAGGRSLSFGGEPRASSVSFNSWLTGDTTSICR